MTDFSVLLLVLAIVVLLFVQLTIFGMLRELRGWIERLVRQGEDRKQSVEISRFEHERAIQSRRLKYRSPTELPMELTVLGKNLSATVIDISETGVMFSSGARESLKIGDSYPAVIRLTGSHTIEASIRLIRRIPESEAFGACFEDLPLLSKKTIREFIAHRAKEELESGLKEMG